MLLIIKLDKIVRIARTKPSTRLWQVVATETGVEGGGAEQSTYRLMFSAASAARLRRQGFRCSLSVCEYMYISSLTGGMHEQN